MRVPDSSTILSILAFLVSTAGAQVFYASLTTFPDWQAARTCVQNCVTDRLAIYGGITLGCRQSNPASCLCGNAQSESTLMHNDIYSCGLHSCSNSAEATSAAGIFNEWCAFNLASTSLVGGLPTTTSNVPSTQVTSSSSPSSPSAASPSASSSTTSSSITSKASPVSTPTPPASSTNSVSSATAVSPSNASSSGSSSSSTGSSNGGNSNTSGGNHRLPRAGNIAIGVTVPVVVLAVLGSCW